MSEERSTDSLLAFLLGAAAGAAAGLLLAPHSGRRTREVLENWLEEGRERTQGFLDKEREVLHHKKDQLSSALRAAKEAYRETGQS